MIPEALAPGSTLVPCARSAARRSSPPRSPLLGDPRDLGSCDLSSPAHDLTPDSATHHNADVIRLALAAIVFCSTFVATFASTPTVPTPAGSVVAAMNTAGEDFDCAPVDEPGEWRPDHGISTSLTDGIWKWRSVHALTVVTTFAHDASPVDTSAGTSDARSARSPAYLLHTPLLI